MGVIYRIIIILAINWYKLYRRELMIDASSSNYLRRLEEEGWLSIPGYTNCHPSTDRWISPIVRDYALITRRLPDATRYWFEEEHWVHDAVHGLFGLGFSLKDEYFVRTVQLDFEVRTQHAFVQLVEAFTVEEIQEVIQRKIDDENPFRRGRTFNP
jgi:hypothetical protein